MAFKNDLIRILLVDDNLTVLWGLSKLVESERPHMMLAGKALSCRDALLQAEERPNVTILDFDLGGWSGLEILPELIRRSGGRVLIHTSLRDPRLHEDAFLLGAMGVVLKDEPAEVLIRAIEHIHDGGFWNSAVTNQPKVVTLEPSAQLIPQKRIIALSWAERELIGMLTAHWANRYKSSEEAITNAMLGLDEILSLYTKLGLRNRAELLMFAMQHGLAKCTPIHPTRH
jgi:DNA-binding NarL/FixJ family response regulator